MLLALNILANILPVTNKSPFIKVLPSTCNFLVGCVVPMPI